MLNSIFQAPAETTTYLIAGYTVIFGIMLVYIISLIIRRSNLKRTVSTLSDLEGEKK